jgi:hypothetical protein
LAGIGHNSVGAKDLDEALDDFDRIAAANLKRGLYRSQAECWRLASNDPRCTWRHLRVLGIVFGFLNNSTAFAFPGWQAIATETATFSGGVPDPMGGYSHGTIRNILSDLQQWGYLPSGGQRKGFGRLTIYTVGTPALNRLARDIAAHLGMKAGNASVERERIERNLQRRVTTPDDTSRHDVSLPPMTPDVSLGDVTHGGRVTGEVDTSPGRVTGRVTGGREQELERELEDSDSSAGAPRGAGEEEGFPAGAPHQDGASSGQSEPAAKSWKPTKAQIDAGFTEWWAHYPKKEDKGDARKAYERRVTHPDPAERATILQLLAAVKAYQFRSERQYIKHPATWLNKGSWMGVGAGTAAPPTAPTDIEAALRQLAESPDGKRVLARYGHQEGMRRLRAIISGNTEGKA